MTPVAVHVVALATLALLIVVATVRSVNMGALAFLAAFVLGTAVLGLDAGEILSGFPVSTGGALAIANTAEEERPTVYRGLLVFALLMMVVGPLVSWAVLVLPGVG